MLIAALVFAGLAALIHVYIFVLESLRFDQPATWRVFGIPGAAEAELMRPWAYNQGFYNLFLAIGTAVGIGLSSGGNHDAGLALVTFSCGSMVAAAPKPARSHVFRARCSGLVSTWENGMPLSPGASSRASSSPRDVSGMSVRPVC
jgi:putative membrane protein